jgi:outer membrane protein TolC
VIEVPASLLEARPDIRAAQKRVEAEDRRLAAAIGARLPQITLSFTPGYTWVDANIQAFDRQGEAHGWQWDARGQLSVPVFDGLRGWSAIKAQRAVADQLIEAYAENILIALLEVESSLTLERQERLRIQFLEDEFRLANITLEATRDRYRAGLSDFLPVLTALATRQRSELQLVAARRQLVSYRIQLYRALGGSWPEEFGEPEDD